VSLPDEGGLRPKHVGGNIICIYAFYVKVVDFLFNKVTCNVYYYTYNKTMYYIHITTKSMYKVVQI